MIQYSNYDPSVLQVTGVGGKAQINRAQDLTVTTGLNREKVKELGRDGVVGWRSLTPDVSATIRQLENGEIDFFQSLANVATSTIDHNDFKESAVDILAYQTDDGGTFLSTEYYPNLRTSGFSVSIADPASSLERSFSLVGEDNIVWTGNNKYVIELIKTVTSGEAGELDIVIGTAPYASYPTPVEDPDNSGTYFVRITRVRSGVTYDLIAGTDYSYVAGTKTITIDTAVADDVYKVVYTASTYIAGASPFTPVDPSGTDDLASIEADSVEVYLTNTSNKVYKLQSVGIDITFDRFDSSEIGNDTVVQRGTRQTNVSITLGRNLEDYTLEEILRGVTTGYGKIDARQFADDITLIVKVFSDSNKGTFKMGYRFENLSPSNLDDNATIDEYVTRGVTLAGETFLISTVEATINNGE